MAITIGTTSADGLTTKEVVKTELSISSTSDDGFIDTLIAQASDMIAKHCGRIFHRVTVTETLPGTGTPSLLLTHTPVVSITSVTHDGSTVSSTAYTIEDAECGLLWNDSLWNRHTLYLWNVERHPHSDGQRAWSITYRAGYVTPEEVASTASTLGARTLPYDVERACIDTVKSLYNRRAEDSRIKRQGVDETYENIDNRTALPPSAVSALERWRRVDL